MYTHAQFCAMRDAIAVQYSLGVGSGLVAGFAPFALLGPALGARSVTPDMDVTSPRTLTARAVALATEAAHATFVFLSPAAIANVVATSGDLTESDHRALAGIDLFLSAGAPVSAPLLAAVGSLMPNASAHTPYGMTEGLIVADIDLPGVQSTLEEPQSHDDGSPRPGGVCVGYPVAGVAVRISPFDSSGAASGALTDAPEVTGEILAHGPHLKDHYDRLWFTERTSRALPSSGKPSDRVPDVAQSSNAAPSTSAAPSSDAARWHRTGDVGHFDAKGRLWIEGRLTHVWSTPAGLVTPVGIEQRIEALDEVSRAALVGVGPAGTQALVAIVELRTPAKKPGLAHERLAADVRAVAGRDLAAVLVVANLPVDIRHNSKIDRSHLASWAGDVLSGGRMRRP